MALAGIAARGRNVRHRCAGFGKQMEGMSKPGVHKPAIWRDADGVPEALGKMRHGNIEVRRNVGDAQSGSELSRHALLGKFDLPRRETRGAAGDRRRDIGSRKRIKVDAYLVHRHLL